MSQTRLRALSLVIVLIFSFLECTTSVTSPQQLDFRDLRLVRRTEPIYPPAARMCSGSGWKRMGKSLA